MKNNCRVPDSGRRKQGKSGGFMCKWRGFVWLGQERGRGLGLDLGFTQNPIMGNNNDGNKCLGGQISGAAKTNLNVDFGSNAKKKMKEMKMINGRCT